MASMPSQCTSKPGSDLPEVLPFSRSRKKRTRDAVVIEQCSYCGPRPRNVLELSKWLDLVQDTHDLGRDNHDVPDFPALTMLLDPDFAYVWTPACTKEFTELIRGTGVVFDANTVHFLRSKRSKYTNVKSEVECYVPSTPESNCSPARLLEDIVDLSIVDGEAFHIMQ